MTTDNLWDTYYRTNENTPPPKIILDTLQFTGRDEGMEKKAIDLGCGSGVATWVFLKEGWEVLAIDNNKDALTYLQTRALELEYDKKLTVALQAFETITSLPPCTLLCASYSIPFCNPGKFKKLWKAIEQSLVPGGIFCGHLFGENDDWASSSQMTFLGRHEVENLFSKFRIDSIQETEGLRETVTGGKKYWHVFEVIAKKVE